MAINGKDVDELMQLASVREKLAKLKELDGDSDEALQAILSELTTLSAAVQGLDKNIGTSVTKLIDAVLTLAKEQATQLNKSYQTTAALIKDMQSQQKVLLSAVSELKPSGASDELTKAIEAIGRTNEAFQRSIAKLVPPDYSKQLEAVASKSGPNKWEHTIERGAFGRITKVISVAK